MGCVMNPELVALAQRVGETLAAKNLRVVTAESCTGGLVATALTEISGSSAWFERGYITYANAAKQDMLGVQDDCLAQHGAVSEACVREMAMGALSRSQSDVALAVSGVAGPTGGSAEKPVGTVCFAWATMMGQVRTLSTRFDGDRASVRDQAASLALEGVLHILATQSDQDPTAFEMS